MQSQHLENTSGFPDATTTPIKKKDLVSRHITNDLLLSLTLTLVITHNIRRHSKFCDNFGKKSLLAILLYFIFFFEKKLV